VGDGETLSWRPHDANENMLRNETIEPGLYSYASMRTQLLQARSPLKTIDMFRHDGILNFTISNGWEIQLTNGILTLLGFADGLGGHWLQEGTYQGDHLCDFSTTK